MDEARDARDDPFAGLRAEREVRDDGRYVIYFRWPDEEPLPSDQAAARAERPTAAKPQPWNVSSGPPDDGPDDDPQRAPGERRSRV